MLEEIVQTMQELHDESVITVRHYQEKRYLVFKDKNILKKIDTSEIENEDFLERLYEAVVLAYDSKIEVNFAHHLCCGFGDTIHDDLLIEIESPSVFLIVDDQECRYQEWMKKWQEEEKKKLQLENK